MSDLILALVNAVVLAVTDLADRWRGVRRPVLARHRAGLVVPVGPGWALTYRHLCLYTPYGRPIPRTRPTAAEDVAAWVAQRRRVAELRERAEQRRAQSGWVWLQRWTEELAVAA